MVEGNDIQELEKQKILKEVRASVKKSKEEDKTKNMEVFRENYIPPVLRYRDKYQNLIFRALGRQLMNKTNFNIFGVTGTGKTITIKYCFAELKKIWVDEDIKAETIYVNCADYPNPSKIYSHIINELGGNAPARGWDKGTYLDNIKKRIIDLQHVIVCLDEIDIPLLQKGYWKFLLALANIVKMSFIFISNVPNWNQAIDPRVKSRVQFQDVEFSPYTFEEINGILQQRMDLGFKTQMIPPPMLHYLVEKAYYNRGDMRDALKLLNILLDSIIYDKKTDITKKRVDICYRKLVEREWIRIVDNLTPPQKLMILLITDMAVNSPKTKITAKVLNERWNRETESIEILEPLKLRSIQNHLQSLKLYQLISFDEKSLGRGQGRLSIVKPLYDLDTIYLHLKKERIRK